MVGSQCPRVKLPKHPVQHHLAEQPADAKQRILLDECGHFPIEQPGLDQLRDALLPFVRRIADQFSGKPLIEKAGSAK